MSHSWLKPILILFQIMFFSCELWETYPRDYYSPVFKDETLIVDGDTADIEKENTSQNYNEFELTDTSFSLYHIGLHFGLIGAPSMGETLKWTDTTQNVYIFTYKNKRAGKFSISIERIPFNTDQYGSVPDVRRELVDSVAFQIECNWDNNNRYTGQIHARKYVIHTTN